MSSAGEPGTIRSVNRRTPSSRHGVQWGVLGGVWVSVDDERLYLSPQSRYVLGLLLVEPGRSVSSERIARSAASQHTRNAARVAVSRLRSQLASVDARDRIVTSAMGYAADIDPWSLDHVRFSQGVWQAESDVSPEDGLRAVEEVLDLWTGEPFGELSSDPAFKPLADALEEQRRAAVDLRAELAVQRGVTTGLIAELELAVAEEPLRERRWAALMLASYRAGNQTAAVRTYDRARAVLREELGLDPGPELQHLLRAVLDHDPILEARIGPVRTRPVVSSPGVGSTAVVGREVETADLLSLLERRSAVVVVGIGGVGKSSLAVEVADRIDRPARIVPLAGVDRSERLVPVICEAMGVPLLAGNDPLDVVAERLQAEHGLLVLDNCEQIADDVAALVSNLTASAPGARFLMTSRRELPLGGAFSFALQTLPTGTRDSPGPAAIIAADAAMIRPSQLREHWDTLEEICRRSDGVPLALQLLAAAWVNGRTSSTDHTPAIARAVASATDSLPAESRVVVDLLAALPGEVGSAFMGLLVQLDDGSMSRALGPAARAGLVVQRSAPTGSRRVRLLEPVREVLAVDAEVSTDLVADLRRVVRTLAAASCPKLLGTIDTDAAVLLDDEHETVLWMLDRLDPGDRLELTCAMAPVWGATGRTVDAQDRLARLESTARTSADLVGARYWVSRAVASPAMSDRAVFVEQLRWAMAVADRERDEDLFGRAGGELVVGLGWSGRSGEAARLLTELRRRLPDDNPWAEATLAGVVALSKAVAGDPGTAADELLELSRTYREIGHPGEVASKLFLAATLARLDGDERRLHRVLDEAEDIVADRFSGYAVAGIALERAKLAGAHAEADTGRLLWQARHLLDRFGEQRMTALCTRELGVWRLSNGDRSGIADLAGAARQLLRLDPPAAAVAIAHLCATPGVGPHTRQAALAAAISILMDEPGGAPLSRPELTMVQLQRRVPPDDMDLDTAAELLREIEHPATDVADVRR